MKIGLSGKIHPNAIAHKAFVLFVPLVAVIGQPRGIGTMGEQITPDDMAPRKRNGNPEPIGRSKRKRSKTKVKPKASGSRKTGTRLKRSKSSARNSTAAKSVSQAKGRYHSNGNAKTVKGAMGNKGR